MKYLLILGVVLLSGSAIAAYQEIDPHFDARRDVMFILNTRENMAAGYQLHFNDAESLRNSHFNKSRPTRFLIHAFLEDGGNNINIGTSRELLINYDSNVVFVDWSAGSLTINYPAARNRVGAVAELVAQYMDFLDEQGALDWSRLTVIGFSLGAHIAGLAGKAVRRGRINTIQGLEPAGPLFSVSDPTTRLAVGDAEYVECIHTNGGLLSAGIGAHIGDADFFVNGGTSQPGCLTNTCSHNRVVDLYVESINQNRFFSTRCLNENDAGRERCNETPGAWMGGEPSNARYRLRGIFSTPTSRSSPFAQGALRPN